MAQNQLDLETGNGKVLLSIFNTTLREVANSLERHSRRDQLPAQTLSHDHIQDYIQHISLCAQAGFLYPSHQTH